MLFSLYLTRQQINDITWDVRGFFWGVGGGWGGCQIVTLCSIGEGQHFQILEICDLHSFVSTHLSMSVVTWSLFHEIKLTRTNYSIILDRFILCRKWVDLFPFAGSTKRSKGLPSLSYQIQVHVFGHLVMKTLQIEFFLFDVWVVPSLGNQNTQRKRNCTVKWRSY